MARGQGEDVEAPVEIPPHLLFLSQFFGCRSAFYAPMILIINDLCNSCRALHGCCKNYQP